MFRKTKLACALSALAILARCAGAPQSMPPPVFSPPPTPTKLRVLYRVLYSGTDRMTRRRFRRAHYVSLRCRGRRTEQATEAFGSIRDLAGGGCHVRTESALALRLRDSAYPGWLRTAWPRVLQNPARAVVWSAPRRSRPYRLAEPGVQTRLSRSGFGAKPIPSGCGLTPHLKRILP
jgi:hypothetical protein